MKNATPLRAIRLKCLDCCAGQAREVRLCAANDCPLWIYRSGHKPDSTQDSSLSQKSAAFLGVNREESVKETPTKSNAHIAQEFFRQIV